MPNIFETGKSYRVSGALIYRVTVLRRTSQSIFYRLEWLSADGKFHPLNTESRAKVYDQGKDEWIKTDPNCAASNLCHASDPFDEYLKSIGGLEGAIKYLSEHAPKPTKRPYDYIHEND